MDKEVWKWILKDYSDKDLLQLICDINDSAVISKTKKIEIKGISDFSKLKSSQLSLFRSRLESEILKTNNLNKLKKQLKKLDVISENKENLELVELDANAIYEKYKIDNNFLDIREIIIHLSIQTDVLKTKKGRDLYNLYVYEIEKKITSNKELDNQTITEDLEKLNQIEILNLKKSVENLNFMLNEEKIKQKDSDRIIKEFEKNILNFKKENNELIKELKKIKIELSSKKESIYNSEKKSKEKDLFIERLNNELIANQVELKDQVGFNKSLQEKLKIMEQKNKNPRKVFFVGKAFPDTIEIPETLDITLIEGNKVPDMIIEYPVYEIWYIDFRLARTIQSDLRTKHGNKAVGFSNLIKLKEYISLF